MTSGKLVVIVGAATLLFAVSAAAEAPTSRRSRDVISADETVGAPPGFHPEERPRYGAIIGGAIATGLGAAMLLTGIEQHAQLESSHSATARDPGSGGEVLMIGGGVSLAVGLPLLVYGLLSPRDVYVRDSVATVSLGVSASSRHFGGGLTLAF
jgi:hypothetical protein